MDKITTVGIDLAKNVFSLDGKTGSGEKAGRDGPVRLGVP